MGGATAATMAAPAVVSLLASSSSFLTRLLLEFGLRVNYKVVALEDIYNSRTHGSSNSKRSLRYDHFREVAHIEFSASAPTKASSPRLF